MAICLAIRGGCALGRGHDSGINEPEYLPGVQVYENHNSLDRACGKSAGGRIPRVVGDRAAETKSGFFRVAEIASRPIVNSDFAEITYSPFTHGQLPALVSADGILNDFCVFGEIARLHAGNFLP